MIGPSDTIERTVRIPARALFYGLWALATWLILLAVPAAAQISNETVVNNHNTTREYQRSYTPAAGENRVVIALLFSEYDLSQNSLVTDATLGGVPMINLGTIEALEAKRNRMTAFLLREADIPTGSANLRVRYGPDPAASLIYLATVLNVDQASAANPPRGFARYCSSANANTSGTIPFAAVSARGNDYVFSFVGTGKNTAFTSFNNGGTELFDERVTGPGFSFAGAVQTPQTNTTISGTAFINGGCDRRPSTFQLVLRPLLGSDAQLTAPLSRKIGNTVTIEVTDSDRNQRSAFADTLSVSVRNTRTGEIETVTLTETGPNTGIFRASLATTNADRGPNNNGSMSARTGDVLETIYNDATNSTGASRILFRQTRLTATDNPAELLATKRSATTANGADLAVPGNDVVYTIEIINIGDGPVDTDTLFIVDTMPSEMAFRTADFDAGDNIVSPVGFKAGTSGLTFDPARDLRFANGTTTPTSLTQCQYTPVGAYDPNVRYICLRPIGAMLPGNPNPIVEFQFRAQIR
ncbi:MAG: hypothetical protein WA948_12405 [Pontixanthobacter sp.]